MKIKEISIYFMYISFLAIFAGHLNVFLNERGPDLSMSLLYFVFLYGWQCAPFFFILMTIKGQTEDMNIKFTSIWAVIISLITLIFILKVSFLGTTLSKTMAFIFQTIFHFGAFFSIYVAGTAIIDNIIKPRQLKKQS